VLSAEAPSAGNAPRRARNARKAIFSATSTAVDLHVAGFLVLLGLYVLAMIFLFVYVGAVAGLSLHENIMTSKIKVAEIARPQSQLEPTARLASVHVLTTFLTVLVTSHA